MIEIGRMTQKLGLKMNFHLSLNFRFVVNFFNKKNSKKLNILIEGFKTRPSLHSEAATMYKLFEYVNWSRPIANLSNLTAHHYPPQPPYQGA